MTILKTVGNASQVVIRRSMFSSGVSEVLRRDLANMMILKTVGNASQLVIRRSMVANASGVSDLLRRKDFAKKLMAIHYGNVLLEASQSGEPEYAYYILGKMFKLLLIEPTGEFFGRYIQAIARGGRFGDAVREVIRTVHSPDQESILSIMGCCNPELKEDVKLAIEFVEYLEHKNIDYQIPRALYMSLGKAGVAWKDNVKWLNVYDDPEYIRYMKIKVLPMMHADFIKRGMKTFEDLGA